MLSALPTVPPVGPLLNEKDTVFQTYTEVDSTASSSSTYLPLNAAVDLPATGATKLRKMLEETKDLIVCPGVYDGLSARTAIELDFSAMYMVSLLLP